MITSAARTRRLVTGVLCVLTLTVLAAVGAALGLLALGAAVPGVPVVGDLAPLVVPVRGPGLVVDQLREGSLGQQAGRSILERWSAGHVGT